MRRELDRVAIDGTIVIGEGERDEAPMLYIGERLGHRPQAPPEHDLACRRSTSTVDLQSRRPPNTTVFLPERYRAQRPRERHQRRPCARGVGAG
jgi:hypothetical protein